jgi:cell division protein YceG involved in septum cleavage
VTSIKAVLMFEPSDYLFYLHDNEWKIHYWRNVSEHNQNKQNFLR